MKRSPLPPIINLGPTTVLVPFHQPDPNGPPIRAYYCTWKPSAKLRSGYVPGQVLHAREDGLMVGTTLDNAIWECDGWPCAVYEVEMDQADLYPMGEILLKTKAFRVLRVVPSEEVFGPRATEILEIMDGATRFPWLAPSRLPDLARVDALVSEHYAQLGGYTLVKPCPVQIVDNWRIACVADIEAAKFRTESYLRIQAAMVDRIDNEEFTNRRNALGRVLVRRAYGRIWDAGWERAYAAFLPKTMGKVPLGDAKAAKREWTKIRQLITDRRAADRRTAIKVTLKQFIPDLSIDDDETDAPVEGASMPSQLRELLRETGLTEVSSDAWNFSVTATTDTFRTIGLLLAAPDGPIPSKPLLELYRMGLWPVGETNKKFVVLVPPPSAA